MRRLVMVCGLAAGASACAQLSFSTIDDPDAGNSFDAGDPLVPTVGLSPARLSAGEDFSCSVSSTRPLCWGAGDFGQLGSLSGSVEEGTIIAVDVPDLGEGETLVSISAGRGLTCGLSDVGRAYCWGTFELEGSGLATAPGLIDASALAPEERFVSVGAGAGGACALTNRGNIFCWGTDAHGVLGNDEELRAASEPRRVSDENLGPGEHFTGVSRGTEHACAVTSHGRAYCWGRDDTGQLGHGTADTNPNPVPRAVVEMEKGPTSGFVSISAGLRHTCAVTSDGNAYCWGFATGLGSVGDHAAVPRQVARDSLFPTERFVSVDVGDSHSCAVTNLARALCWGDDSFGQLGDGNALRSQGIPVAVSGTLSLTSITAGGRHTCAMTTLLRLYCWGDNRRGQLGDRLDGDSEGEPVPVALVSGA